MHISGRAKNTAYILYGHKGNTH